MDYTIEQAAKLIAGKLFPPDCYDFTDKQRDECEKKYLPLLKEAARSGLLRLTNPHTREAFDHRRLSDEFFPDDLLISSDSLYGWLFGLLGKDARNIVPPPIRHSRVGRAPDLSNLPPTLAGLPAAASNSYSKEYKFDKPDWNRWTIPDQSIRLWEGICLVVDMEPPRRPGGGEICSLIELKYFPPRFHAAWDVLNRDEAFSTVKEVGTAGRMLHTINLSDFAYWAIYKGFDVSPDLRQLAVGSELTERSKVAKPEPVPAAEDLDDEDQDKDENGKYPWAPIARSIGEEILPKYRKHNLLTIAEKIREVMVQRQSKKVPGIYAGRGGKIPDAETIKRHALTGLKA